MRMYIVPVLSLLLSPLEENQNVYCNFEKRKGTQLERERERESNASGDPLLSISIRHTSAMYNKQELCVEIDASGDLNKSQ